MGGINGVMAALVPEPFLGMIANRISRLILGCSLKKVAAVIGVSHQYGYHDVMRFRERCQ